MSVNTVTKHQGCKFLNVFYGRHIKEIGDERHSRKAGGHNSLHYSASVKVLARHLKGHPPLRLLDTFSRKNSLTALQLSNKSFIAAMFSGRLYLRLREDEFVPFFYSLNFLNIAVVNSAFLNFYFEYFNDLIYRWTHNIFMILISARTTFAAAWMIWIFIPDAFGNCVKQSGPVLTLTSQVLGGMCAFCFKSIT